MSHRLTLENLEHLILTHLGPRADVQSIDPAEGQIDVVLYAAYTFRMGVDPQTGVFGMILLLPGGASVATLIGHRSSLNNDEQSILESLRAADEYCRLRLPDKYLEAFDARMGTSGSAAG